MKYLLKTRALTGAFVPARGEHREYEYLSTAIIDGKILHEVFGDEVIVTTTESDEPVAFVS